MARESRAEDLSDKTTVKYCLREKGVYVLFRDDEPYYVGKTKKALLYKRIKSHATKIRDRYYHFWKLFLRVCCSRRKAP